LTSTLAKNLHLFHRTSRGRTQELHGWIYPRPPHFLQAGRATLPLRRRAVKRVVDDPGVDGRVAALPSRQANREVRRTEKLGEPEVGRHGHVASVASPVPRAVPPELDELGATRREPRDPPTREHRHGGFRAAVRCGPRPHLDWRSPTFEMLPKHQ
jgi:hypothetical protein